MNLALGGNKGAGAIDPAFYQDFLEIDYIRVYKNNTGSFTLSDKDFLTKQTSIFPNRLGWLISTPERPIKRINIYNLDGKQIGIYRPNTKSHLINNESLSGHINFAEVFHGNQRTIFKIYKSN